MENTPQYVAAIDVGTTKIVTLLGKRTENKKLEIVGFSRSDSKGIRRGEVLNPEEASNVVKETIFDLQRRTGIIFSEVFVGIAGQHIRILKSRNYINRPVYEDSITVDDINQLKSDANNIALEEGKEIIHILPQSYIVDNETDIFNPVGMLGKRLEANFNIVVGNIDSIKRIRKCIHNAGLDIREIILEPLASADAVLYDEERESGVALVDIGGGTTDIAVFYENVLRHSAVIPFGGYVVTKDIKDACGLGEQVAEEVKVQFGMALSEAADENKVIVIPAKVPGREPKEISFRNLAHIIQSRMEEIIDAIMFHIENSGCADKLGSGIVITGGGAMLKHLKQLFHYRTGMDVRIGYPGEQLSGDAEAINEPRYATGIGLLMKGFCHMDEYQWEMATTLQAEKEAQEERKRQEQEMDKEEVMEEADVNDSGSKIKKPRRKISFDGFKESIIGYFNAEPDSEM
ncbi:MAG: cell division protein FtsA [Bacteroidales bacterium]|jgi:cell division protein FtsA|nr:cell division protein FtsA [Bacteroidales bacterium]